MHTLGIIFSIALLALAVYVAWTVYSDYRKETGTTWNRLLATAEHSATILWAKFCVLIGLIASGLASAAEYLGDPSVGTAIQSWFKPEYAALALVVVSMITILARKRTL